MVPETKVYINRAEGHREMAKSDSAKLHYDEALVQATLAVTEATLAVAQQLGELISLVSAIGTDLTTREE